MPVDVVDLREFYATPLGRVSKESLRRALGKVEAIPSSVTVMGVGYPLPILDYLPEETLPKTIVLMPARQGALRWPTIGASRTALVDEDELPVANASMECIILMHALENVAEPAALLDEIWRILAPEGRLVIIATNRRGLWSRFEHTPFGTGQPFSKRQLGVLLRKAKLTPLIWTEALNFPPVRYRGLIRLYPLLEKVASRLWPVFCGAFVIVATKRLYQGIPQPARKSKRAPVPVLAPQAAPRTARRESRPHRH